ncbi:MAG: DNA alkylation repair protein [Promethearchaeota archaeon]
MQVQYEEVLKKLEILGNPKAVAGMKHFGITAKNSYGISIPNLRNTAKKIGKNHHLAQQLWASGIHDARILATMIEDPKLVTEEQMEDWVKEFDSWDICDQCCNNLFRKTDFAYQKVDEWSNREEEYVKRAAFSLMASLAVHDKEEEDDVFINLLSMIRRESTDERNFVKKAVNWSLRQIGKRNLNLNKKAIETAKELQTKDSKSAKWIATNALRELKSEKTQKRLNKKR